MSVRLRVIAFVLLGLIAAGFTAYWFHVAGELRKGIEAFAAQRRAEGWTVEMGAIDTGGFPRAVIARLGRVGLRSPAGLSWHGEGLVITIPLLDPLNIAIDLPGLHDLGGLGWSGIVSAGAAQVRLRLRTDGEMAGLAFTATALALEQPGIDPLTLDGAAITFERLNPPDPGHEHPSAGLTLALRGLGLPDISGLPLARRIERFQVEARVMGEIAGSPPLAALAAWSADGGIVELDRIALDWPPLALEADGTLALDPKFQPLLATHAHVRGWGEFVVRLVQAGLVEQGMASAAQVMLAILARPDSQGRPTLSLPLTVQDGILSAGQVRVMQVPRLPISPLQPGGRSP
ncbi:MAG: DUF2125 domain-containing protein [Phaeospirillum sp.]|nr:DUF2125 domain-containing protein [Phaeospirillum sp.]